MKDREEYITTNDGVKLFCRIMGKGEPLLLIHGMMVDADFFYDCAKSLTDRYMVITYDRRGYSRSTKGIDYSLLRQTQDAAQVLQTFAEGPADVVGCSAGAVIALILALNMSQLVRKTILHEIPLFHLANPTAVERKWFEGIRAYLHQGRIERALREFMIVTEDAPDQFSESAIQQYWENGLLFLENEFEGFITFLPKLDDSGCDRGNHDIFCAVGADSGSTYAVRASKALSVLLNTSCISLPGRHNGARDVPEGFANSIAAFLHQDD